MGWPVVLHRWVISRADSKRQLGRKLMNGMLCSQVVKGQCLLLLLCIITFCSSRNVPRKSGFLTALPAKADIFFRSLYNCSGKADLGKGYWNPKRKLGVAKHFSEIQCNFLSFKALQFGKKIPVHCFVFWCFFELFCCLVISKKMHGYPQFSFWIPTALVKIPPSHKPCKNTLSLVGTVLKLKNFRITL